MAKLYYSYAAMNAGKSTSLLQVAYNYEERGMRAYLLTAAFDTREGEGKISSRIGISREAELFEADSDVFKMVQEAHQSVAITCVLVDEAQWLSRVQVDQLARVVDELKLPVMCYSIRTDFQGNFFPGSERLMAIADEIREIRTICHCGKKATMILRLDAEGAVIVDGPQNFVGGNESYVSVCRKHWVERFVK